MSNINFRAVKRLYDLIAECPKYKGKQLSLFGGLEDSIYPFSGDIPVETWVISVDYNQFLPSRKMSTVLRAHYYQYECVCYLYIQIYLVPFDGSPQRIPAGVVEYAAIKRTLKRRYTPVLLPDKFRVDFNRLYVLNERLFTSAFCSIDGLLETCLRLEGKTGSK